MNEECGMHRHKCECGFVWEHANTMFGTTAAHTCARCGREQWTKHFGSCETTPAPGRFVRPAHGGYPDAETESELIKRLRWRAYVDHAVAEAKKRGDRIKLL